MRFIGRYKLILALSVLLAAVSVILQLYDADSVRRGDRRSSRRTASISAAWLPGADHRRRRRVGAGFLGDEPAEQPDDLPHRAGPARRAIRHIQVLPLSYLDRHSTGDIVSRVIADTGICPTACAARLHAVFGRRDDRGDAGVHVLEECLDHADGDPAHAGFLVAKFIASRSHMFRRQARRAAVGQDGADRGDDRQPEGRARLRL